MKEYIKYGISLCIVFLIIVPWYVFIITHTNRYSILSMYKGTLLILTGVSIFLIYIMGLTLLFEIFRHKKFQSIFYLTVCFFALSYCYGIIYQLITSRLDVFQWDSEAHSITHKYYIRSSIVIILGLIMLVLHIISGRIQIFTKANK